MAKLAVVVTGQQQGQASRSDQLVVSESTARPVDSN